MEYTMKRTIRIFFSVLLGFVVIAGIGIFVFGGAVICRSVNVAAPGFLGVPATLQDAELSPFRGRLVLLGLRIGNPKGYKTESLVTVDRIDVQVSIGSLLSDTIVIRRILVDAPQVTFERGMKNSNLGALMDQLGGGGEKDDRLASTSKPSAPVESGKKVVVDELVIVGGKVKLSVTAAMGLSAPIALADIRLANIGRKGEMEGIGVADVVRIVLGTVMRSVVDAIGGVGGLAVDGVKAIGGGVQMVGEAAVDGIKKLGGEKATAGVRAMSDGAAQIGGAAVEGVKSVGKAIGGLFGGNEKTNFPAGAPLEGQSRPDRP
jgi:hypothetical protein